MIAEYLSKRYKLHPGCNELPFDRREVIRIFAELGYKTGVEIGVNNGRFAQYMCENIPGLKYYGVDPYNRYDDSQIAPTNVLEKSYQKAAAKLVPRSCAKIAARSKRLETTVCLPSFVRKTSAATSTFTPTRRTERMR